MEEYAVAGGVGTGLFVIGKCACCDFDHLEEIDFREGPTEAILKEAEQYIRSLHKETECNATIAMGFIQNEPYRNDLVGKRSPGLANKTWPTKVGKYTIQTAF
ncbi:MAG: hypothetical protein HYY55_01260 [Candidatus Niyogibacteria bacterium]|nr:MAG: hypothetical protein HYY55_01260 [Candidatus Niyogibacteria bacterium]